MYKLLAYLLGTGFIALLSCATHDAMAESHFTNIQYANCAPSMDGDFGSFEISCEQFNGVSCQISPDKVRAVCTGNRFGTSNCELVDDNGSHRVACSAGSGSLPLCRQSTDDVANPPTLCSELPGLEATSQRAVVTAVAGDPDTGDDTPVTLRMFPAIAGYTVQVNELTVTDGFLVTENGCQGPLDDVSTCDVKVALVGPAASPLQGSLNIRSDHPAGDLEVQLHNWDVYLPKTWLVDGIVGQTSSLQVDFYNYALFPVSYQLILGTALSQEFAISDDACAGTIDPDAACTVTLSFTPTAVGTQTRSFYLKAGAIELAASVRSNVELPRVSLATKWQTIDFGRLSIGREVTTPFVVFNDGNQPVTIASVQLNDALNQFELVGATDCLVQLAPGESCAMTMTFRPSTAGAHTGSISIATSAPTSPLEVTVLGNGYELRSSLDASPTALDFGAVVMHREKSLRMSIRNDGELPVAISSISINDPNAQFSSVDFANCLRTLDVSAWCDVTIEYRPTLRGAAAATLTVDSNAIATPKVTVPLTGNGALAVTRAGDVPELLNLGRYAAGVSHLVQIPVRNVGAQYLYLDPPLESKGFSIALGSCAQAVAPGDACQMNVTVLPTAGGLLYLDIQLPANTPSRDIRTSIIGMVDPSVCP